jgi:hypothetical protein
MRSLPARFKVDICVKPGSHNSEHSGMYILPSAIPSPRLMTLAVNKQLNDKERVAAALENPALIEALEICLASASQRGQPSDSDAP